VAAIEAKFWANFCRIVGVEECIDKQYDAEAQDAVRDRVAAAIVTKSRDEWVAILAAADTCVAPVLSLEEAGATAPTSLTGDTRLLAPLFAGMVRRTSYEPPTESA